MLTAHNFTYGLLTPALGFLMSCLGAFLGLRCTARAMALDGRTRLRWLLLAAVSIGTTGIWVMHFIAMLGYTVPGQVIHYNVLLTIASMLIAVVVVGIGLLIVGFAPQTWRNLVLAGTFTGIGVAGMHYTGMAALRMPARMSYSPQLFALSVLIAIVAATAALWAALRLRGTRATLAARGDHGRCRQRHALHRHGRHAHVPGGHIRRHAHDRRRRYRGELRDAAGSRHQRGRLHPDGHAGAVSRR